MSTPTAQPTTASAKPTTREYLWVMTVRVDGQEITAKSTCAFPAGATREQAFDAILRQVSQDIGKQNLTVGFFALEPNTL
ncbi:hypothetical protein [Streptomyces gardneri]|uniref:hypothetical protein n=1 Tax=Streptomyces gardneri TaxID=66892 RepID=UPI0035DA6568